MTTLHQEDASLLENYINVKDLAPIILKEKSDFKDMID